MNAFKIFDAYSLRARLFPALLGSASLIAALAILIPWHRLSIAHAVATIATPIILFAMADLARRIGKKREPGLYATWGGMPTTVMMRHADTALDPETKAAYLGFLAGKINVTPPNPEQEAADPAKADAFYDRCARWLRENSRDSKTFSVLFNENITYGFRRNLFALKWPVLILDTILLLAAAAYLIYAWPELDSEPAVKALLLIGAAVLHALYIALAATEASVREAANTYARQLLLGCETLGSAAPKPRKPASPSRPRENARENVPKSF